MEFLVLVFRCGMFMIMEESPLDQDISLIFTCSVKRRENCNDDTPDYSFATAAGLDFPYIYPTCVPKKTPFMLQVYNSP